MTRDEILKMPAGREMDALIAEKLFGQKWFEWEDEVKGKVKALRPENVFAYSVFVYGYAEPEYMNNLPFYSTDISATWKIIDKVKFSWFVSIASGANLVGCTFQRPKAHTEFSDLQFIDYADSAPLAICRAALLAVYDEKDSA